MLPKEFRDYTRNLMGEELYACLEHGLTEEESPVSIRLNPMKWNGEGNITNEDTYVPWCPATGRYLSQRPNFTFDPLFHAGLYYVQEASSMFVDLVVRQLIKHPIVMLDLCAAPGGKSTALRSALPMGSLLVSNEPMRTRAQILSENIQKWGDPDVFVTNNYPRDFRKSKMQFDAILADVPCSGEGMFRKDAGAINEWSTQNVKNCWTLQREIIEDIWPCLKPGGILIYSTCTFNAHEDEENVEWIIKELDAEPISVQTEPAWNITPNLISTFPVYRFLPGKTKGEGLFLAVLRKKGELILNKDNGKPNKTESRKNKKDNKQKGAKVFTIPEGWLKGTDNTFLSIQKDDALYALPAQWMSYWQEASKSLHVLHAGIKVGTQKGKDLIPAQSLALSTILHREAFCSYELNYTDAIAFLRKETIVLPEECPKGYVLLTYRNVAIGWGKNLGNRVNNLYPQEWKIKSTHIPEEPRVIL